MSDSTLRELLYSKYNVTIQGVDCIEMAHVQLVINTVREYDSRKCPHDKNLNEYCEPCGRIHNEN